jgi:hypothetical protein
LSLFGFAWLGFGLDFILRFLALAYDPSLFQATTFPLSFLPGDVLSRTWLYMAIYWVVFCLGFAFVIFSIPQRAPKFLKKLELLGTMQKVKVLDLFVVITALAIIVTNLPGATVPGALVTPLGLIGSLYVIPAAIAWFLYFYGKPIGLRRFIYMFPGIILYILSPYREHILTLAICAIVPALMVRRKISARKVAAGIIIVLLVATIITSAYRTYLWEEMGYVPSTFSETWESWHENPTQTPWVSLMNRFHGFDSMALTVHMVPAPFPYSERNIMIEFLTQGFLPRAIYYTKSDVQRGREFSAGIWALDEKGNIVSRFSAMIAPTMSGDLYSVNGLYMVILGAFLWGLIIGFLERCIRTLGPITGCVLIPLFGLRVAGGIERDFVNASASVIQVLIVLLLVVAVLPVKVKSSR